MDLQKVALRVDIGVSVVAYLPEFKVCIRKFDPHKSVGMLLLNKPINSSLVEAASKVGHGLVIPPTEDHGGIIYDINSGKVYK